MLDPSVTAAADVNSGLVRLMKRWGITIGNDLVIDKAQFVPSIRTQRAGSGALNCTRLHVRYERSSGVYPVVRSVTPVCRTESSSEPQREISLAKTVGGVPEDSWGETQRETDGTFSRRFYPFHLHTLTWIRHHLCLSPLAVEQKIDQEQ